MSLISTPEFFINMRDIPTKDSVEYLPFFERETEKIQYGVDIDGIHIHGWLYWHLNHWNIYTDIEDKRSGTVNRIFKHPDLRDNEWIIQDAITQAELEKKGIMLFGVRRFGKTEMEASWIGRSATIFKGTQNLVTGGNWVDIDLITTPLTAGLNALHPYFVTGRISENLRKDIELGTKDRSGKRNPWSKIMMRNYEDGNNEEAAAGVTPSTFVIDEVGKFNFAKCLAAAKPAFTSPFGWRCCPILTGTSGYLKQGSDAEKFFNNPEANNFIVRELKEEGNKRVSVFISGLRRIDAKQKITFGKFIQNEKGILVPANSELNSIPFYDSDFDKANAIMDEERRLAKLDPDPTALLKATMYSPKNTQELFLTDEGSDLPLEAINETIDYLERNPHLQGEPVSVYRTVDGKVKWRSSDKLPVMDYPLTKDTDTDVDGVMYEPPMDNAPVYLYIAGSDPYNQNESRLGSLGSNYIYKRMYDPISGTFNRRIVFSYTARPKLMKDWHEKVEMMLELYGAICLPENEASTFIQFFDAKNKGHLLADGYNFLKEIAPNTSSKGRVKGLPASTVVQKYYHALIKTYLTEMVQTGTNEETGEFTEKMGVVRIPDIMLLRELAAFKMNLKTGKKEGNYDRYVAFGHVLAHEVWADKIYPLLFAPAPTEEEKKEFPKMVRSPFGLAGTSNPFSLGYNPNGTKITQKPNPFGINKGQIVKRKTL